MSVLDVACVVWACLAVLVHMVSVMMLLRRIRFDVVALAEEVRRTRKDIYELGGDFGDILDVIESRREQGDKPAIPHEELMQRLGLDKPEAP